jgi:hypothetical protein
MDQSVAIQLAEAIVAELRTGEFILPIEPARKYLPIKELPDVERVTVQVVPATEDVNRHSRDQYEHEYTTHVSVEKKLNQPEGALETAEIDALMKLAEEISDHFTGKPLADQQFSWVRTERRVTYSPEHMDEMRTFTAVTSFTHVKHRDK